METTPRTFESLSEAVGKVRPGTLVGWRTPGGQDYGVVLGIEGKDLICATYYDKSLAHDKSITHYRDEDLTSHLAKANVIPGVFMDVQRVPAVRAFKRGNLTGAALQPYIKVAAHLQLEDRSTEAVAELLDSLRAVLDPERLEEGSYRWVRQKYGVAKARAHREFVKMVRRDPTGHRMKMLHDRQYHRRHKWHDALMRRTKRSRYRRIARHHEGVLTDDKREELTALAERQTPDPASMKVQTLIFAKSHFDKAAAKAWAKGHGFKSGKVDEKENTFRLRQRDPDEFETFRTITFKPGLKAVVAKI